MEKSGFFGQVLFGKNAKVRIFWSPDFKRTTVNCISILEHDEDFSLVSGVISVTTGTVYEESDVVLDHFIMWN